MKLCGDLVLREKCSPVADISPELLRTMDEMVDIMTSVFDGTARGLAVDGFCAGKTGTTNDSKDSWFCGITDKYSVAVWVGRDDAKTMGKGVTGSAYAGHIWHNIMKKLE